VQPGAVSKSIGDEWIRSGRSAVLTLPSVLVPLEKTFLLTPKHRDFDKITIKDMSVLILDPRLRLGAISSDPTNSRDCPAVRPYLFGNRTKGCSNDR
jgi:hypothetical protein